MFYKKGSKIEIERKYKVNKGDALIFFSTMRHSVDEIIVKKTIQTQKISSKVEDGGLDYIVLKAIILKIEKQANQHRYQIIIHEYINYRSIWNRS